MGLMTFLVPDGLPATLATEMKKACVSGGPDSMPWPTEVEAPNGRLTLRRDVDESGCLMIPWGVDPAGLLVSSSATLIERQDPYHLQVELARGKVNQLRTQAGDWQVGGLVLPEGLAEQIRTISKHFARVVTQTPSEANHRDAQAILNQAFQAAEGLVELYIEQMFEARHQRQARLEVSLGCRLGGAALERSQEEALLHACNCLGLALAWNEVEPSEANYCWDPYDNLLAWATTHEIPVIGGPLIDFSATRLPDWLWLWDRDLSSLSSFMCDYVGTVVKRYAGRIHCWQLTAASNCAAILGLGEEELLWLTARLIEAARQIDPNLELTVGIAQPWGEYMATEDRTYSPFVFADTLIRSGLNLGGLDLEMVMGVSPRGSYCRDLLDSSRMLDLYSMLGVPVRVTMGYPSSDAADERADKDLAAGAGRWHGGFSPSVQADWASAFTGLALCKPSIRGVQWIQASDAVPHQFPHCGLFSAQGNTKPALARLRELRESHLP
jgi:hypothetical protein